MSLVSTAVLLQEREPPRKPEAPFTVFVHAAPRGEPEIEERLLRARTEFEKSIGRKDDWFLPVGDRGKAEIVVEVQALFVDEETGIRTQTTSQSGRSHTSHYLVAGERSQLHATAILLGSNLALPRSKAGKDEAEAASALAKELERYVKKNYWTLVERRDLFHAAASDVPMGALGREWIRREILRRLEAMGAEVGLAEWSGETLFVRIGANEFRFPFPPKGFDDCAKTMDCQRRLVEQVMGHLAGALGKKSR